MKYSEFLQLKEMLESQGTTLYKELGIERLNEAGETDAGAASTPDTESGNWITRWGRIKNTLNKNGKKLQTQINKKIIGKYLPTLLKYEVDIANQVNNLIEKKTPTDQIKKIVSANLTKNSALQVKQLQIIEKTIDTFLENSSSVLDKKIQSSKMNSKNKLNITNYWLLLKTQIKMNSIAAMQTALTNASKEALGGNTNAENLLSTVNSAATKSGNNPISNLYNTLKSKVNDLTTTLKNSEQQTANDTSTETITPEIGKKYTYTDNKNNTYSVTIDSINDNGGATVSTDNGKKFAINAEKVKTLKNIDNENTNNSEVKPEVGKKYSYTDDKNQQHVYEISKDNGDGTFVAKTPLNKEVTLKGDIVKKLKLHKEGVTTTDLKN